MAHKLILSLASDVFDTMFYGEATKHEDDKKEQKPIPIDDIQFSTFKLFLSFIYYKIVEFETPEIAAEFYYAADKYNCIDALDFIKDYMLEHANAENATFFYSIAFLHENSDLKEACIKIFSENTVDVLNSPKFLNADPKTVELIYKLDKLNISSEKQLIDALERYIKHNQNEDREIAEKVLPALSQIRFLTLTPTIIAETTLLDSEDIVTVIGCLPPKNDVAKMPSFLSMSTKKRDTSKGNLETIRKLTDIFSTKFCGFCSNGGYGAVNHPIWNCSKGAMDPPRRTTLKRIYDKYKHAWLMDYDKDDVATIFEAYKASGFVE